MPSRFLSEADRVRLEGFPVASHEDVLVHFTLSDADLAFVRGHRTPANRLGVAVQLCALRWLGFIPADLHSVPPGVLTWLAEQLGAEPKDLATYGRREQTRSDHAGQVRLRLGFRSGRPTEWAALAAWLLCRALEHDKPTLLLSLACDWLLAAKVIRPGLEHLERMVAAARQQAIAETYRLVEPLLTPERRAQLDGMLVADVALDGRTRLSWLRRGGVSPTARVIAEELDKVVFLRELGVGDWDLAALNPNRQKFLAQLGRRSTNQALQRLQPERRYPILLVFLRQTLVDVVDEVLDLFDRTLAMTDRKARRRLAEQQQLASSSTHEKMVMLAQLIAIVVDDGVKDPQVRSTIFETLPRDRLLEVQKDAHQLVQQLDGDHLDELAERFYGNLRKFVPAFLRTFDFQAHDKGQKSLLDALNALRQMNEKQLRKVPADTSLAFAPPKWAPRILGDDGQIHRRHFELCALFELRGALRAGDVWLSESRRYTNPASYLLPPAQWTRRRAEVCAMLGRPPAARECLEALSEQLDQMLPRLEHALQGGERVRVEDQRVVVSPLKAAELADETAALNALVAERLPRVDLVDLLIEVDSWTGFSECFTHAGGSAPRSDDHQRHLYGSILAQACNLGLAAMVQAAEGLSLRKLTWTTNWYLREDTLKSASAMLVDHQHRLPLAQAWGGGTLSSSDGQRFPVRGKAANADSIPRYFGFGQGLTFYTWTADQYAQYGSKAISATVRDATYVLDEILDNETELPILEHTTDTAGYTELVFALFDLLGLQFSPRIRDLGAQRLYRMTAEQAACGEAGSLLKGTLNQQRIVDHWDDLLRVAGSLKLGWVTASLLISRLQAQPRKSALTRALQEYGRLIKTLFILRWLESEDYRRRINRQLNKGESLHALRRFLFFANEGRVRHRTLDDQANQVSCLNLVTNAVIVWNTVYMQAAVDQLGAEGTLAVEADLSHLSPGLHEHVNPYGRYHFAVREGLSRKGLRPLRGPEENP